MAKKTRYPGVTRKKDGRYVIRAAVKAGDVFKQKRMTLPAGTSLSAAVVMLEELKDKVKKEATLGHLPPAMSRVDAAETIEDYAYHWLDIKKQRLAPSAYHHYETAMYRRVLPRIGHVRCRDARRGMVEAWVAWAEKQTKTDGTPYAEDTLKTWWRPMVQMLRDMAADHDIPDPVRRVRPPEKPEVPAVREQSTLTLEQVGQLLADCKDLCPDRYPEIATLAMTGMRVGEMHALMWDAVDFERGEITVKRSISSQRP